MAPTARRRTLPVVSRPETITVHQYYQHLAGWTQVQNRLEAKRDPIGPVPFPTVFKPHYLLHGVSFAVILIIHRTGPDRTGPQEAFGPYITQFLNSLFNSNNSNVALL